MLCAYFNFMKKYLILLLFFGCNRGPTIEQIQESNIRLEEQINSLKTQIYSDSIQNVELRQNYKTLEHEYEIEKKKYRPTDVIFVEKLPTLIILSDSQAFRLLANNLKSTNY